MVIGQSNFINIKPFQLYSCYQWRVNDRPEVKLEVNKKLILPCIEKVWMKIAKIITWHLIHTDAESFSLAVFSLFNAELSSWKPLLSKPWVYNEYNIQVFFLWRSYLFEGYIYVAKSMAQLFSLKYELFFISILDHTDVNRILTISNRLACPCPSHSSDYQDCW